MFIKQYGLRVDSRLEMSFREFWKKFNKRVRVELSVILLLRQKKLPKIKNKNRKLFLITLYCTIQQILLSNYKFTFRSQKTASKFYISDKSKKKIFFSSPKQNGKVTSFDPSRPLINKLINLKFIVNIDLRRFNIYETRSWPD